MTITGRKRRLSVGMYTTVGPRCGIADYTRALVRALEPHADVTTVPLRPGSLNPFRTLVAGLRLSRQDIAHVQHTYSFFGVDQLTYTVLIRLLLMTNRAPLVLTAHTVRAVGPSHFAGGMGSRLANRLDAPAWHDLETFRRPRAVIVHANSHRDRLLARRVPADRIHVIPPGIPPHVPVEPAEVVAFRTRFGVRPGHPVIGVFGFLEAGKRVDSLLEAVAGLPGSPTLLVAGGPRLASQDTVVGALRLGADRLGTADRVVVTGYVEPAKVPVAFEAMDVVFVPYATDDSMSYSLHLALGQFRPVVATDLPPLREVQVRGECLWLVPPEDPTAWREALGHLLADGALRTSLATAARAYAAREGVTTAALRTVTVYQAAREVRQ
jgi:glycosyltransferase involved in cell wall biosynthesis